MTNERNNRSQIIRRATRTDVPAIVRLLADDPLGQQREQYQHPLPDAYYQAFELIDQDANQELVVVEQDGRIIATLQLTVVPSLQFQGGTRAQIEAVRVDQRVRRQGIGQHLMAWVIARARERGCQMVQLSTHASRRDAHRFYERLGFVGSHVGMKLDLAATPAAPQRAT